ncbi:MAG: hypothetical protein V3W41_15290 [Planctomycetota bacterium]
MPYRLTLHTKTLLILQTAALLGLFCGLFAACGNPANIEKTETDEALLKLDGFSPKKIQVLGAPVSTGLDGAIKFETLEFELAPGKYVEYMFDMKKGAVLLYSWSCANEKLAADFHGHPQERGDYPKGFWFRYASSGQEAHHGKLETPIAGLHGWYFKNHSKSESATVKLKIAGNYLDYKILK